MSKKYKIALGTDAFYPNIDGICSTVMNYATYLNKNHCDATVVTPKNPHAEKDNYDFEVYRYKSLPIPNKDKYPIGWPFKEKFRNDLKSKKFDLLHSHCPLASSYFFRLVKRIYDVPVVLTYHTKYEYDIMERVHVKYLSDFAKRFLRNNIYAADEVWVPSEGTAESLRKFGYGGSYRVMPNGVDMARGAAPKEETDKLKAKYNIKADIPVFIFVGRIMWYKNLKIVLESLKNLKDDGVEFKTLMVGGGKNFSQIKKYAKKLGLENDVIFTGVITDRNEIKTYFSAADLLLFPSTFDTNGLVVREAAACSVPSLLIENSCAAEGIKDSETGFLCEENTESFSAKLKEIISDRELIRKVGENASEKIYLSWEDAVANAYDRYTEIIEEYQKHKKINDQNTD